MTSARNCWASMYSVSTLAAVSSLPPTERAFPTQLAKFRSARFVASATGPQAAKKSSSAKSVSQGPIWRTEADLSAMTVTHSSTQRSQMNTPRPAISVPTSVLGPEQNEHDAITVCGQH